MKVVVVGTGYVGLVTGACLAEVGSEVICVDVNKEKIAKLNQGIMPLYEPGLDDLVSRNSSKGRLSFSEKLVGSIDDADVVFIAVGTPPDEDGSADLKYVLAVAREIGAHINGYTVVVTKSTVPVGTAEKVRVAIREELDKRAVKVEFDIASNPEFLKEGAAIQDFLRPDRIIIGVDTAKAQEILTELYQPFVLNGHPLMFMDICSAELTKYAANAMLATRISFMNDIANLCELVGADINEVRKGIGSDPRIGSKFLYAGAGYGGSCFPKDVRALITTGKSRNYPLRMLEAVELINDDQKLKLYEKVAQYFDNDLKDKHIAIWGLAFKPNTDDIREAPALAIIDQLLKSRCQISVFDPVAMENTQKHLGDSVRWCNDIYDTAQDANAVLLVTEWNEFRLPDWERIGTLMKDKVIFDGRNIYNESVLAKNGFTYYGIGC